MVQGITERAENRTLKYSLLSVRRSNKKGLQNWSQKARQKESLLSGKTFADETLEAKWLKKKYSAYFVNRVIEDPEISYVAVDVKKSGM